MIKVMLCRLEQCLGTFTMLLVEGSSETRLSRHLHSHVQSRQFRKYKRSEGNLFLKKIQNLVYISKMLRETAEKSFFSETITSELVSLNCLY